MELRWIAAIGYAVIASAAAAVAMRQSRPIGFDALAATYRTAPKPDLVGHAYARWTTVPTDPDKRGVVTIDAERTSPGYNLFCDDREHALLVDSAGEIVHAWRIRGARRVEYARLLDDGDLIAVAVGEGIVRVDVDGAPRWRHASNAHHEIAPDRDGGWVALGKHTMRLARRDGSAPVVGFDHVDFLDASGRLRGQWSTSDNIDALRAFHGEAPVERGDDEDDFYHVNSVQVLPDTPLGRRDARFAAGNWLVCLRNVDLVAVVGRASGRVTWHWGPGTLDYPHMPQLLPGGTLLVFDNGTHRGHSIVREIDPTTGDEVWSYGARPDERFFSAYRGSCQRLPNGNTLICSSDEGRVFEVTRDGDVVWDFYNPIRDAAGRRRGIYRCERVPPAAVEPWLSTRGPSAWWLVVAVLPSLVLLYAIPRRRTTNSATSAPTSASSESEPPSRNDAGA